jgi:hypothetical protein
MSSFLRCPVEVCDSILAYLSRTDLRNLCLVHKGLRTLAEPYLYSEIHFTWQEYKPHPITSLLRSLLRRPQLATYVCRISLVGDNFFMPHYRGKVPKIAVTESELEEPLVFVTKSTVSYRGIWLEELRNGTMTAFIAVLLSQPLRLTHLFIDSDFFKESQFTGWVFRSMLFEPQDCGLRLDFAHLETVSLGRHFDGPVVKTVRNTADVLPFLYLPSVKQLSASIENPFTFSWPATHPPSPSNLRSLKLRSIREPFLGQLLSVMGQLQTLDWEWYYDPEFRDQVQTPVIDLNEITTAISYVRETLTELVISALCGTGGDLEFPPLTVQGSLKGMTEFDKLRKFTVPLTFLMGFSADFTKRIEDHLPRSLEFLTITDNLSLHYQYDWWDHELLSVLETWLENFQTSTPHLCGITLSIEYTHDNWNHPIGEEFQGLCSRVGIRFEAIQLL